MDRHLIFWGFWWICIGKSHVRFGFGTFQRQTGSDGGRGGGDFCLGRLWNIDPFCPFRLEFPCIEGFRRVWRLNGSFLGEFVFSWLDDCWWWWDKSFSSTFTLCFGRWMCLKIRRIKSSHCWKYLILLSKLCLFLLFQQKHWILLHFLHFAFVHSNLVI